MNTKNNAGIEVRESINQGFVHSEIGSGADDKALQVYKAAEISPSLLERNATMAINNYMSAISCYLRAIPNLQDARSSKLLREEVNRLLKRLEHMRTLASEASRLKALNNGGPVRLAAEDRVDLEKDISDEDLMAQLEALVGGSDDSDGEGDPQWSPAFQVGAPVQVSQPGDDSWRDAAVISIDPQSQTYTVQYDDNSTTESNVDPNRLRTPRKAIVSLTDDESLLAAQERFQVVSEIIESERSYVHKLNNLKYHYIDALKKPAHWGGQRDDSLFTMKTMNQDEQRMVFSNIEDIISGNIKFLHELEERLSSWTDEQGLADIFIKSFPLFNKYVTYVSRCDEGMGVLEKMRKERLGVKSAEAAAKAHKVETLPELMQAPKERLTAYIQLVQQLLDRTPYTHRSRQKIEHIVKFFRNLQRSINNVKNKKQNQEQVKAIGKKFKPSIDLFTESRVFVASGELAIMNKGKAKTRNVWLFNDLLVYGRPSWLVSGSFRHIGSIQVAKYGNCDEYGPLAFFIENSNAHRIVLIAQHDAELDHWFEKLDFCPQAVDARRQEVLNIPTPAVTVKVPVKKDVAPPLPPKPARPGLPTGWVELTDDVSQKKYYYNEEKEITQWERPT